MPAVEQFRARYPQGGLIGEFIALEGNLYLVRVSVRVDDTVLATGLAAAETVEAAEDRARDRALAGLGLALVKPDRSLLAAPGLAGAPYEPSSSFPDLDLPPLAAETDPGRPDAARWEPQQDWEPHEAAELPTPPPQAVSQPAATAEPPPTATPDDAPEPLGAAEVVARAKAELKRLGWTREQGQKFLIERYGKRTTRDLLDREWRDLYEYLYQQPNPAQSS